eukprot:scaffold5099_cov50-Attheya_sp.AAC.6
MGNSGSSRNETNSSVSVEQNENSISNEGSAGHLGISAPAYADPMKRRVNPNLDESFFSVSETPAKAQGEDNFGVSPSVMSNNDISNFAENRSGSSGALFAKDPSSTTTGQQLRQRKKKKYIGNNSRERRSNASNALLGIYGYGSPMSFSSSVAEERESSTAKYDSKQQHQTAHQEKRFSVSKFSLAPNKRNVPKDVTLMNHDSIVSPIGAAIDNRSKAKRKTTKRKSVGKYVRRISFGLFKGKFKNRRKSATQEPISNSKNLKYPSSFSSPDFNSPQWSESFASSVDTKQSSMGGRIGAEANPFLPFDPDQSLSLDTTLDDSVYCANLSSNEKEMVSLLNEGGDDMKTPMVKLGNLFLDMSVHHEGSDYGEEEENIISGSSAIESPLFADHQKRDTEVLVLKDATNTEPGTSKPRKSPAGYERKLTPIPNATQHNSKNLLNESMLSDVSVDIDVGGIGIPMHTSDKVSNRMDKTAEDTSTKLVTNEQFSSAASAVIEAKSKECIKRASRKSVSKEAMTNASFLFSPNYCPPQNPRVTRVSESSITLSESDQRLSLGRVRESDVSSLASHNTSASFAPYIEDGANEKAVMVCNVEHQEPAQVMESTSMEVSQGEDPPTSTDESAICDKNEQDSVTNSPSSLTSPETLEEVPSQNSEQSQKCEERSVEEVTPESPKVEIESNEVEPQETIQFADEIENEVSTPDSEKCITWTYREEESIDGIKLSSVTPIITSKSRAMLLGGALSPMKRFKASKEKFSNPHVEVSPEKVSRSGYSPKDLGMVSRRVTEINGRLKRTRAVFRKNTRRETGGDGVLAPRKATLKNPLFNPIKYFSPKRKSSAIVEKNDALSQAPTPEKDLVFDETGVSSEIAKEAILDDGEACEIVLEEDEEEFENEEIEEQSKSYMPNQIICVSEEDANGSTDEKVEANGDNSFSTEVENVKNEEHINLDMINQIISVSDEESHVLERNVDNYSSEAVDPFVNANTVANEKNQYELTPEPTRHTSVASLVSSEDEDDFAKLMMQHQMHETPGGMSVSSAMTAETEDPFASLLSKSQIMTPGVEDTPSPKFAESSKTNDAHAVKGKAVKHRHTKSDHTVTFALEENIAHTPSPAKDLVESAAELLTPLSDYDTNKENSGYSPPVFSSASKSMVNPRQQATRRVQQPGSKSELCLSPLQRTPMQARKWRELAAKSAAAESSTKKSKKKKKSKRNPFQKINA